MTAYMASAKPHKGLGMEGWIARWYTRTRRNDMEDFRREARNAAQHLRTGCNVLEVAPGPGFFAIRTGEAGKFQHYGFGHQPDVGRNRQGEWP